MDVKELVGTGEAAQREERNRLAWQRWIGRLQYKAQMRRLRIQAAIDGFSPVDKVAYRTSPTTGLKRPMKPRPMRGG